MVARVAVACRVVGDGLVFRDLTDDFAGEPGHVLRDAARVAVIGQLRRFPLELTLAVARGGQRGAGQGRSQVGELADEVGQIPEHRGKVPAERHPVLARPGHVLYVGQGPGDRAGPRGQILKGIQHRAVGPRHGSFGFGPQVPPQAFPRVPGGPAGLLCRHGQLAVVPRPGLHAGVRFGGGGAEILQGTGSGMASREDHTRSRRSRVPPMTPPLSMQPSYPGTRPSHLATGLMALSRVELIEADKANVVVLGGSQSVTEAGTGIAAE